MSKAVSTPSAGIRPLNSEQLRIAGAGCYLEWDLFGRESSYYTLNPNIDMPGDAKRITGHGAP